MTVRPDIPGLPETVPSRMLNEFVYCPRLFHLEWVQSRFATSDDVEEGRYLHRVVDEESGDLPDKSEAWDGRTARSVSLSSPGLGLAAKLDLVEDGGNGSVVPDEMASLKTPPRERRPLKRLMAPILEGRPVYVTMQGSTVGIRNDRLEVRLDGELQARYRLIDVSQLCVFGNVTVSSQAVREFMSNDLPILWFHVWGLVRRNGRGTSGQECRFTNSTVRGIGTETPGSRAEHDIGKDPQLPNTDAAQLTYRGRTYRESAERTGDTGDKSHLSRPTAGYRGDSSATLFREFPSHDRRQHTH